MESPKPIRLKFYNGGKRTMKKVLALVLAVMMLSTMALATDTNVVDKENNVGFGGRVCPGDEMYVYRDMETIVDSGSWIPNTDADVVWNANVNSSNYTITSQKWTKGKELLAGNPYFDDDKNQLVIKLKEDYTLKQVKTLSGKFTLKGKGKGGTGDTKPNNIVVTIDVTVGNYKDQMYLDKDNDRTIPQGTIKNNYVYKFQKTTKLNDPKTGDPEEPDLLDDTVHTTDDYGTVILNTEDEDVEVTFRGYKGDELFLYNKTSANSALLKAYADKDADITFLTFEAEPTFNSTATVRFYKDEESHVYVMKDGKLVNEVKWDEDESCFLLKTRTLGAYVFSDKALPFNVETTANPDTGANDVVGIATALAAVALVSAAAVSLKK